MNTYKLYTKTGIYLMDAKTVDSAIENMFHNFRISKREIKKAYLTNSDGTEIKSIAYPIIFDERV